MSGMKWVKSQTARPKLQINLKFQNFKSEAYESIVKNFSFLLKMVS